MSTFSLLLLLLLSSLPGTKAASFSLTNKCAYPIWPALLSGAGSPPLPTTGFLLPSGDSLSLPIPPSWSGRLWARTHCSTNPSSSLFSCATADCHSGQLPCSGAAASPPATLAEFTLNASSSTDFFDVSLVDGFNLPILISPSIISSSNSNNLNCSPTGCPVDINALCPSDLRVPLSDSGGRSAAACRSACDAFAKPEFCCSGAYASPDTCKPSSFSRLFKNACPRAYSYAYDDATSTFTCPAGVDYIITFCPSVSGQKAGENNPQAAGVPLINDTMVFLGPASAGGAPGGGTRFAAVGAVAALWLLF